MLYSLNHYPTCRFEVRQALIYQLVSGLTDENGKYNYAKAVHHYPPFFDISCSAKNYKIASALTPNGLRGNLYQQDQHQIAVFAERAASPYTDVTVAFYSGKTVRVPEKEYNYETIPNLKYHYGDILDARNEADDESVVQGALHREHERRERMPKVHIAVHVQELEEARIQTEADRLAAALQSLTEPNTPDKTHFMAEVSPYFLPLASHDNMHRLFEKVRDQVKQPIYIAPVEGANGQYIFMRREERAQEQPSKPSIKEQLAAKPAPGDQPAAKSKNREVR